MSNSEQLEGDVELQQQQRGNEKDVEDGGYRIKRRITVKERWKTIGGDCPALRDYVASKSGAGWAVVKFLLSIIRGFSQTTFSNNPVSGVILIFTVLATGPGTFLACLSTGVLGHIVSTLIHEPDFILENGLAVFNPLIYGAVSYYFVPIVYGGFDSFSIMLLVWGVIFIAYVWRACGNGSIPALTMPFNVAELLLLFTLKYTRENAQAVSGVAMSNVTALASTAMMGLNNGTISAALTAAANATIASSTMQSIATMENATTLAAAAAAAAAAVSDTDASSLVGSGYEWSMIFRASIVGASQLFVIESVPLGAIVYLAVIIYSPVTCLFGFLGSLGAALVALQVGAPHDTINAGLWGFNGYLTGASLGGNFLVINGHTGVATCVAIIMTALMQHVLQIIFLPSGLPCGTLPFVLTTWLFIGLGKVTNGTYMYPKTMSYPEGQRQEMLAQRRLATLEKICEASEPEHLLRNGKESLT